MGLLGSQIVSNENVTDMISKSVVELNSQCSNSTENSNYVNVQNCVVGRDLNVDQSNSISFSSSCASKNVATTQMVSSIVSSLMANTDLDLSGASFNDQTVEDTLKTLSAQLVSQDSFSSAITNVFAQNNLNIDQCVTGRDVNITQKNITKALSKAILANDSNVAIISKMANAMTATTSIKASGPVASALQSMAAMFESFAVIMIVVVILIIVALAGGSYIFLKAGGGKAVKKATKLAMGNPF